MSRTRSACMNRDLARRRLYNEYEIRRRALMALYHDQHLNPHQRSCVMQALHDIARSTSLTRTHRRCIVSGRSRGVLRRYRVSRLVFRRLAAQGRLPGVYKASW
jgi:ribosomal protein S14